MNDSRLSLVTFYLKVLFLQFASVMRFPLRYVRQEICYLGNTDSFYLNSEHFRSFYPKIVHYGVIIFNPVVF